MNLTLYIYINTYIRSTTTTFYYPTLSSFYIHFSDHLPFSGRTPANLSLSTTLPSPPSISISKNKTNINHPQKKPKKS
ncbi:hypothetical protein HanPSC8_Chr09g0352711 [Helianthus annuus]|nr:hypothetical protein HanPSC8_Chr09g0352711 [Helianthus annuus]